MALVDDGFAALADARVALGGGEDIGFHLFLNSPPTRVRRAEWFRISLERHLADRFVDVARQAIWDIEGRATEDGSLAEFDFDAMVEGSIGVLSVRDTPGLSDWLDSLPHPDLPEVFDGEEDVLKRSRFYGYRLTFPDGRQMRAFRGRAGLDIAARKRHAVSAMFHRDTRELTAIEGSVITFDPTPDFFEWDGLLFVVNMRAFESLTNIRDVTVRKALAAMDAISERFVLPNVEGLKETIGKRTRLGKRLASAHKHGLVEELDAEQVTAMILSRGLQFTCAPDADKLSFAVDHTNARAVEDFVDLMADVFLVSPTTRRDWEALVKRPPRRRA